MVLADDVVVAVVVVEVAVVVVELGVVVALVVKHTDSKSGQQLSNRAQFASQKQRIPASVVWKRSVKQ